jgi:hypothetical protein
VKLDEASPEKLARNGGSAEPDGTDDKGPLAFPVAPLTPELAERFKAPKVKPARAGRKPGQPCGERAFRATSPVGDRHSVKTSRICGRRRSFRHQTGPA